MQPNFATAASLAALLTGVVAGLLSIQLSRGPGWSHLRWFAWASLATAVFGASDLVMSLPAPQWAVLLAGSFNLSAAGLHGAVWLRFFAEEEGRPMSRLERACAGIGIVGGVLAFVPGLYAGPPVQVRALDAWGFRYHEPTATPGGPVFYVLCLASLVPLLWLSWRAARRRQRFPSLWVGFVLLFACVMNDILSATRLTDVPYLVDAGLVALAISAAANFTADVVRGARQLQESSLRLEQARAALVERERLAALGELAAVVAHEVRNPLQVIFNALAGLKHAPAGGPERELLAIIQEEAERLSRLVSELLDFVKPFQPKRRRHDLKPLLVSAADGARAAHSEPAGAVLVDCADRLECDCDPDLVRQALSNLIVNALASPGRRSAVRVEVAHTARLTLRVAVVDDGAGVAEEHLPRLFSPFFTTRQTGTGLGLALVRRVAEAHGGKAHHEPTPGGGATFVLELPATAAATASPARP